mgnify:CR=1 FL=1
MEDKGTDAGLKCDDPLLNAVLNGPHAKWVAKWTLDSRTKGKATAAGGATGSRPRWGHSLRASSPRAKWDF